MLDGKFLLLLAASFRGRHSRTSASIFLLCHANSLHWELKCFCGVHLFFPHGSISTTSAHVHTLQSRLSNFVSKGLKLSSPCDRLVSRTILWRNGIWTICKGKTRDAAPVEKIQDLRKTVTKTFDRAPYKLVLLLEVASQQSRQFKQQWVNFFLTHSTADKPFHTAVSPQLNLVTFAR